MPDFLDDLEPVDIDEGIFEEEDENAAIEDGDQPAVIQPTEKTEEPPPPETTIIEHEDMVVDTETGEVLASGVEAGLPTDRPDEEEPRENVPAEPDDTVEERMAEGKKEEPEPYTDEQLDELFGNDGAVEDKLIDIPAEHTCEAPKEEQQEQLEEEPQALPARPMSQIQKAINLMEFKHIKDLDPREVKFEDCDFGEFENEIKDAQQIVDGYYTRVFDVNPVDAEYDLGKLSALMVRVSRAVGYFQGLAEMNEDHRKFARAAIYTELKELKDEHSLRISDKDADHTARTMSGKYILDKAKAVVLAKMVTNFWFSMRRFIDILEGIIIRGRSEAGLERHAEAAVRYTMPPRERDEANTTNEETPNVVTITETVPEEQYELGF